MEWMGCIGVLGPVSAPLDFGTKIRVLQVIRLGVVMYMCVCVRERGYAFVCMILCVVCCFLCLYELYSDMLVSV